MMHERAMAITMKQIQRSGRRFLRLTTKLLASVTTLDGASLPSAKARAKPKEPRKAKAQAAAFSPNPGGLSMHVHVPAGLPARAPLVVLLHGCGQDPEAFAAESGWTRLADTSGFALLMPGQMEANNRHRCFNWFRPADTGRDLGEAGSIHAMIEAMLKKHRLDPGRVFVTGLSAGGAMTACLLASYPGVFAAGAVVAGLPAGSASGVVGAMTRMAGHGADLSPQEWMARARALAPIGHAGPWPRLSVWRGEADTVVAPINGSQLAVQWTQLAGLEAPPEMETVKPGVERQRWGKQGEPAQVELWTVAGMGHVYPVAGADGISAAKEIARFWGL